MSTCDTDGHLWQRHYVLMDDDDVLVDECNDCGEIQYPDESHTIRIH